MGPTPLSLTQFTALLRIETARIEDDALRRRAVARYLPPYPVQLVRVDHADHPHYVAWVFAESPDRAEGAAYCDRGAAHGAARWAVVALRTLHLDGTTRWFEHAGDVLAHWLGAA
ncbi:MAG: hypothetical protein KDK06_00320 [Gammaproteobacteria bacterium]|nr:hypothetical protein [Gammaproteobacteria bacterium]